MTLGQYILDEQRRPVRVRNSRVWAQWFETANRRVAVTHVCGFRVSTVFLGLDHGFGSDANGQPVLWETMVFDDTSEHRARDLDGARCAGSWDQAEEMHLRMVRRIETAFGVTPKES